MTGKDRIHITLAGEQPDRVPFVPNIMQWFHVNDFNGTLPNAVKHCKHPVEVLKTIGADVFSKFEGKIQVPVFRDCEYHVAEEGMDLGRDRVWGSFTWFERRAVRKERLVTPVGTLNHAWEYQREAGTAFEKEHWWKDWSDFGVVRYWIEHTDIRPDLGALRRGLDLVGDSGVILLQLLETPLKKFHWLAGQVNASYFLFDHPSEMRELAELYERKALEFLEQVVDLPEISIFEVPDNVDTLFYPPRLFREFCLPVLKKQAQMVHARRKYLFLHSCGRLKGLAPIFLEAGVDCLEGQAPPPLGDWHLHEARDLSQELIVCGGMAAPQQELKGSQAAAEIDAYVRKTFASMGDRRRFLFGSSCNTSPRTPYENLLAFRDSALRYGRM